MDTSDTFPNISELSKCPYRVDKEPQAQCSLLEKQEYFERRFLLNVLQICGFEPGDRDCSLCPVQNRDFASCPLLQAKDADTL